MAIEVFVDRTPPAPPTSSTNDPYPAFVAAIKAAVGDALVLGHRTEKSALYVILTDSATPEQQSTALSTALAHDFTTRTAAQTAAASRRVSFDTAKAAITDILADVAADDAILAGTPTSEQILTVLRNMVDREALVWQSLEYLAQDVLV